MRIPTNWDNYDSNPDSFLSRIFSFNLIIKAYRELLKAAKLNQPITILEFGCGTGYISKWLCENYNVKKITLIDSNEKLLKIAKKTLSDISCKKEFIQMDFFKFKSRQKYDLVHSQGVIEHFESKKRLELLKKHAELTKSKKYCIIYSPTPTYSYSFFRKIAELLKLWKFPDEVPLKKETIIQEMESLGSKALKINYFWGCFLTEVGIIFKKK